MWRMPALDGRKVWEEKIGAFMVFGPMPLWERVCPLPQNPCGRRSDPQAAAWQASALAALLYLRDILASAVVTGVAVHLVVVSLVGAAGDQVREVRICLLYTSDAADEL